MGVMVGVWVLYMDVIVWMCFIWGYMWVYEGDLIWSRVLYCWGERGDYIGLVWNLGGWLGGGVLGEIGGLWLDYDLIGECDFIVCVEMK